MATLATVRGANLGRSVLGALTQAALHRGDRELLLHAQGSAVSFYEPLGYRREGPPFEAAGLPHQAMRRSL
jgi:predicted GNAT family N-acyltransferase